jgi:hypothetical protein
LKKCRYCAEEIQEEALKCKHCGEFLNKKRKWLNCLWGCLLGFIGFIILINIIMVLVFILIKATFYALFYPILQTHMPRLPGPGGGPILDALIEGVKIFWGRIKF